MTDSNDLSEFPDLSNKLSAPARKSMFERQRAEAEAKRIREEAETAAVFEDFVKSFEGDSRSSFPKSSDLVLKPQARNAPDSKFTSGPPKRPFAPGTGRASSGPGSLGPPPNQLRKRAHDGTRIQERGSEKGIFAFEDGPGKINDAAAAFRASDDEDEVMKEKKDAERAAPKPTLQLLSLPPGTSPAVIKNLLLPNLTVDSVRVIAPTEASYSASTERKSMSAIVTLAKDTPASNIDTAVNALQNRYLGWGHYLSLSRHLSSAALGSVNNVNHRMASAQASLPFGAKSMPPPGHGSHSRAPPPNHHGGGFAPPTSYNPADTNPQNRAMPRGHVKVMPPSDIKQLKLIHKTLEEVLTHGPEFEALLMSRPEVQREKRWAWLWDSRSLGGVWYRWRLWQILTGINRRPKHSQRYPSRHIVFEGGLPWTEPEEDLSFEFTTRFEELLSDPDYDSSGEDDSGDERVTKRRLPDHNDRQRRQTTADEAGQDEQSYLNPLQRSKLTHLLSRLPKTNARLRKGDVARVTAFAISHAGQGAEEVVGMLVSNIFHPLNTSKHTNPDRRNMEVDEPQTATEISEKVESDENKEDSSASILIGLYLVSDILSASSTSGVRHAWRYRGLFESAFKSRKLFSWLGKLDRSLGWGRLRAEKWKRSLNAIFQLWEGWCVFSSAIHEAFVNEFLNPALSKDELAADEAKKAPNNAFKDSSKSKWKTVDVNHVTTSETKSDQAAAANVDMADTKDSNGGRMDDLDGEAMDDLDGEPMDDIDGEPMDEDFDDPPVLSRDEEFQREDQKLNSIKLSAEASSSSPLRQTVRRPRAEDMFADSDGE